MLGLVFFSYFLIEIGFLKLFLSFRNPELTIKRLEAQELLKSKQAPKNVTFDIKSETSSNQPEQEGRLSSRQMTTRNDLVSIQLADLEAANKPRGPILKALGSD